MLTAEENERLTRVGPGTPMGNLLRSYWHPIAASGQLDENPVKAVRLLGEDLTLFKDKRGELGLIADRCAHRHVKLVYGIPEENGLRCCYHGWLYDRTGQCIEQPAEPADSRFKDKIRVKAYPVQELAGTVFAYLGPEPAPLVPRWDHLVWGRNVVRHVVMTTIPCNWLQVAENFPDACHNHWLHGVYYKYVLERMGVPRDDPRWLEPDSRIERPQAKLGWDYFENGIVCRMRLEGATEDDEQWSVGHPVVFPNSVTVSGGGMTAMEWAVPVDDTHTLMLIVETYPFTDEVSVPELERVPFFAYDYDIGDETGSPAMDVLGVQDNMVFATQGQIADRTRERLGESDRGIIMHRQLLKEQMAIVDDGGEPINVFRDPEANRSIPLPAVSRYTERGRTADGRHHRGAVTSALVARYSPFRDLIENLYAAEAQARGIPVD